MAYWEIHVFESSTPQADIEQVTRYAETNDVFAWLRELQLTEAPRLITYGSHREITQEEYEQGVG